MPLNANNFINTSVFVPLATEDENLLVTELGTIAPDGTFIYASTTLRSAGARYPHEQIRTWLWRRKLHD
jgi:hypothetical protein